MNLFMNLLRKAMFISLAPDDGFALLCRVNDIDSLSAELYIICKMRIFKELRSHSFELVKHSKKYSLIK